MHPQVLFQNIKLWYELHIYLYFKQLRRSENMKVNLGEENLQGWKGVCFKLPAVGDNTRRLVEVVLMVCVCVGGVRAKNVRWPSRHSGYVIIKQSMQASALQGGRQSDRQTFSIPIALCLHELCFYSSVSENMERSWLRLCIAHEHTSAEFESGALWRCSVESSHCSFIAQSRSAWDVVT